MNMIFEKGEVPNVRKTLIKPLIRVRVVIIKALVWSP